MFEVLSDSTEAMDRGYKFSFYRRVESLREYVLVSQTEPRIEVFAKGEDGKWVLSEFVGLDSHCRLTSVNRAIALREVYEDVITELA